MTGIPGFQTLVLWILPVRIFTCGRIRLRLRQARRRACQWEKRILMVLRVSRAGPSTLDVIRGGSVKSLGARAVVSPISRKTSEMCGTRQWFGERVLIRFLERMVVRIIQTDFSITASERWAYSAQEPSYRVTSSAPAISRPSATTAAVTPEPQVVVIGFSRSTPLDTNTS